jgi:hypothetical protein
LPGAGRLHDRDLLVGSCSARENGPVPRSGGRTGTFRYKLGNHYRPDSNGTITVESRASSSVAWRDLPADRYRTPILRRRWRVDQSVPATDLARKGGYDRSLAIHLAYARVPEQPSLFERACGLF